MASLKDWANEYYYLGKGKVLMYWHRNPHRYLRIRESNNKPTIVLIPGINSHWGGLQPLAKFLNQHGYPVLGAGNIKRNMSLVDEGAISITETLNALNINSAILVGHSKGGIVGKQILAFHNPDNIVKGLVAITTPFNGASLADMMPMPAYKELIPGSPVIKKLQAQTEVNHSIVTISAFWDNMVKPEEGTKLDGALQNMESEVRGHNVAAYDPKVWRLVLDAIKLLEART